MAHPLMPRCVSISPERNAGRIVPKAAICISDTAWGLFISCESASNPWEWKLGVAFHRVGFPVAPAVPIKYRPGMKLQKEIRNAFRFGFWALSHVSNRYSSVNWLARQPASCTSRIHGCKILPMKFCAASKPPILASRFLLRRLRISRSNGARRLRRLPKGIVESGIGFKAAFPERRPPISGVLILPLNSGDARNAAGAANFS